MLAAHENRRLGLRHLEVVGADLDLFPEVDVRIEPVLRHILRRHAKRIGLQLDFGLPAMERFTRDRVDVVDLLVSHREAAGRRADAVHHYRAAGAPQRAVIGVGIADVEREIIVGVRVHLPGRDCVEAFGHLHVALPLLRTKLA